MTNIGKNSLENASIEITAEETSMTTVHDKAAKKSYAQVQWQKRVEYANHNKPWLAGQGRTINYIRSVQYNVYVIDILIRNHEGQSTGQIKTASHKRKLPSLYKRSISLPSKRTVPKSLAFGKAGTGSHRTSSSWSGIVNCLGTLKKEPHAILGKLQEAEPS